MTTANLTFINAWETRTTQSALVDARTLDVLCVGTDDAVEDAHSAVINTGSFIEAAATEAATVDPVVVKLGGSTVVVGRSEVAALVARNNREARRLGVN